MVSKLILINAQSNLKSPYIIGKKGDVILCDTRPVPEGGIGEPLRVLLPDAKTNAGRVVTIKDAGAHAHRRSITIERQIPDVLDGGNTALTITEPSGYKTFISDGERTWFLIGTVE